MTHELVLAARQLSDELDELSFPSPITHVYNPLRYAEVNYATYVERFATPPKKVVFLGMNPGPWGMAQTGVPFGDASIVRQWFEITGAVERPENEHPKRPIAGLDCHRSEVSGTRLWGAVQEHWGTPERFFADNFIGNYCPLSFMVESGRNVTPDKVPLAERKQLYEVCDRHLRRMVSFLQPRFLVGIGAFAEARARIALEPLELEGVTFARILHPSPASPKANTDWAGAVRTELEQLGLCPESG